MVAAQRARLANSAAQRSVKNSSSFAVQCSCSVEDETTS